MQADCCSIDVRTAIMQPLSQSEGLACLDIVDMDLIISSTRGNKAASCCHTFDTCLVGCMCKRTLELL